MSGLDTLSQSGSGSDLVLVLVLILVLVLDDLPLNIRLSSSKLQEADPGSHVSIFSRSVLSGSATGLRSEQTSPEPAAPLPAAPAAP